MGDKQGLKTTKKSRLLSSLSGIEYPRKIVTDPDQQRWKIVEAGLYAADELRDHGPLKYSFSLHSRCLHRLRQELKDLAAVSAESVLEATRDLYADADEEQQKALGYVSGALLEMLFTKPLWGAGKGHTEAVFDGKGKHFSHLFAWCGTCAALTVRNVRGDFVCYKMASHGGTLGRLELDGVTGDWLAAGAASDGGRADAVLAHDCRGDSVLRDIASDRGRAGIIVTDGCSGDDLGRRAAASSGSVGCWVLRGCTGEGQLRDAGRIRYRL